ncbi:hypothetical protein G7062_02135 [Erysipelothrix sp. HDW6C]|uniref:hypothetical protein n=1 Tax=Erysipelothrix sp. HDW6C TaxID=2714930 RepID=UPI0014099DB3|nr:hypothetical protein [Erysipelothrix sp. HDW6C]QIK69155.1 hypothetical protein G7062_02135 [Erysipelothrix sp. HDW6C]
MARKYRWGLVTIILAMLITLFLFTQGFRTSKEMLIREIRREDNKYQDIVFDMRVNNDTEVIVFQYDDCHYAPVVLKKSFFLWKNIDYYYEDITVMGMIPTKIGGVAYNFESLSPTRLNFLNLSLNDGRSVFLTIDEDLDNVVLVDDKNNPIGQFGFKDNIFTLTTDKVAGRIIGYDENGQEIKRANVLYSMPSFVDSIEIFDTKTVRKFKKPIAFPSVHDYLRAEDYPLLPFVSEDSLDKPVLKLHVNTHEPVFLNTYSGLLSEYDGHKSLTYYKVNDIYILEVFRYFDNRTVYYEVKAEQFDAVMQEGLTWVKKG